MGTTTTLLTESESRLAETEQVLAIALRSLTDIADGNVSPAFLSGIEIESEAVSQELMVMWMRSRARAALAVYNGGDSRLIRREQCVDANALMLAALKYVFEHIADPERGPRDLYSAFGLNGGRALEMVRVAIAKAEEHTASVNSPDMLAALRAVEQWWLTEEMTRHVCTPYAIFAVHDAIAKAEGHTP